MIQLMIQPHWLEKMREAEPVDLERPVSQNQKLRKQTPISQDGPGQLGRRQCDTFKLKKKERS